MVRKKIPNRQSKDLESENENFKTLLHYILQLASHKLGYPVSLLSHLGIVDNTVLGIMPRSLANVLLNNVGDPFKDSETSLMEVKKHERELISILERYYGLLEGQAKGYVTTGGTEGNFASLWWSKRYLISVSLPSLIKTDDEIKIQINQEQELTAELAKIPFNDYSNRMNQLQKIIDTKNAISKNRDKVQELLTPTVFYSRGPTHYSIPKIAEILRLNIRTVNPNPDGSINLDDFKKELLINLSAHPDSPIICIANIGTTITGAIDNVPAIKKIITDIAPMHPHTIHMDGALTGFVMPILKPFGNVENYFNAIGANTLAVSAHKYPGLSQPCGIILAQKSFFDKAFEKSERSIDYVGNIIDVTITGSRSGLNVLMFYNAIHTLNLHKNTDKLTEMVNNNIENAKYLYEKLKNIYGSDKVFYPYQFNVMFPKPSMKIAKKYQLMLTGEKATICVLTNVTKDLIDQFIKDLIIDKESAMENRDYKIVTLTEEHVKPTVDLFVKSFCDSEPITKQIHIDYQEYEPFAKAVVLKGVKDGLSKVAIDQHNKIIACCIADDITDPFVPNLSLYPKLKPILALLQELSKSFLQGKKFLKGKILHVWIAAVDPLYRGKGLSTQVEMACIEAGAKKGFDFAYAEFTSPISENVTHQFKNVEVHNQINFSDFKFAGSAPFKDVKGRAVSYVATLRPGLKLDDLQETYKVAEKY